MTAIAERTNVLRDAHAELGSICTQLSQLTGLGAPELHAADQESTAFPLFIYGILGGKDVGKTTLINALAGGAISREPIGIGPGTHTPVIYAHRDDAPVLAERLAADAGLEFELVTHDREVLRRVVLVDLPDFDSKRNLPDHARRAAAFKPHLDAFIWVTTVRKIDHPELLRQMQSVAPKKENFVCVVTFADEVIQSGKDSMAGLRRVCLQKMQDLYFPEYPDENLFVICTLDRRSYDFPELEERLIRQHSPAEIAERRRRNALRSMIANIGTVARHYRIDETAAALADLQRELPGRCEDNIPEAYWATVTERVGRLDGPYRRMAARLFSHRIWGWPILSALLFPLSAVISYLGGRLFFETGTRWADYHQLKEILTVDGLGLGVRMRRAASELRAKFLRLHQLFRDTLTSDVDTEAELEQWSAWLDEHDRKTLDELQARYPRPGFLKRWLVYLPMLWFPLAQPILQDYLALPELTQAGLIKGFSLTLVKLLSASYLLRSAAVLTIIYALWLLWFYASSARQVARRRLAGFDTLRQATLEPSLIGQLLAPYEQLADLLREIQDRLKRQEELLSEQLDAPS